MATALLIAASGARSEEVACDAAVVRQAWDLLKLVRYGQSSFERAAFVMRGADGQHSFLPWNDQHAFCTASYSGVPPRGAVAIIHTHPNSTPYPSDGDERLALRTGLPVYVLTRTMVCRTTGHGVEHLLDGDWNPERPQARVSSVCGASFVSVAAAR
jgi:proteasome lid subunit RPN8/RPN11